MAIDAHMGKVKRSGELLRVVTVPCLEIRVHGGAGRGRVLFCRGPIQTCRTGRKAREHTPSPALIGDDVGDDAPRQLAALGGVALPGAALRAPFPRRRAAPDATSTRSGAIRWRAFAQSSRPQRTVHPSLKARRRRDRAGCAGNEATPPNALGRASSTFPNIGPAQATRPARADRAWWARADSAQQARPRSRAPCKRRAPSCARRQTRGLGLQDEVTIAISPLAPRTIGNLKATKGKITAVSKLA